MFNLTSLFIILTLAADPVDARFSWPSFRWPWRRSAKVAPAPSAAFPAAAAEKKPEPALPLELMLLKDEDGLYEDEYGWVIVNHTADNKNYAKAPTILSKTLRGTGAAVASAAKVHQLVGHKLDPLLAVLPIVAPPAQLANAAVNVAKALVVMHVIADALGMGDHAIFASQADDLAWHSGIWMTVLADALETEQGIDELPELFPIGFNNVGNHEGFIKAVEGRMAERKAEGKSVELFLRMLRKDDALKRNKSGKAEILISTGYH